jgi:tetratricopeptide (TPR) repeat protein
MKKETIVTALICLAVGFLAGYITDAQLSWNARQKAGQAALPAAIPPGGAAATPAGITAPQGLPEGHPPIDATSVVKQMEDVAAQNPRDPSVRLKLANFLYDQKQYNQAIVWYQQALEINPKDVDARTDLGTAYFYTGRFQDALREYHQSLQLDPKHEPTLLNSIIVNLEGTHDLAAAQETWARLHKVNPNNPALASLKEKIDAARTAGGAVIPR